jgi:hypothetical protein
MKMTAVRSQDQRRMLQANSHTFPTNSWIHRITKGRESDRCDLCRALWIAEDGFSTEKELPEQTLGPCTPSLSQTHIKGGRRRALREEISKIISLPNNPSPPAAKPRRGLIRGSGIGFR